MGIILQAFLVIFLGIGIAAQFSTMPITWVGITFLGIFCIIILSKLLEKNPKHITKLAVILILIYAVIILGFSLYYRSPQISDFGVYYRCGTSFLSFHSLKEWVENCQSNYLYKNSFYWTRSLLYTVPFGIVFGDNYSFFKLFNALIHVLTVIVFYRLIKNLYGKNAAFLSTLMLILNPEWWFTLTLATSDNLIILLISLSLFLMEKMLQETHKKMIVILTISFLLLYADFLRGIGLILILAMMTSFFLVKSDIREGFKKLLMGISVIGIYYVIWKIVHLCVASPTSYDVNLMGYIAAIDFSTTQDFGVNFAWVEYFWQSVPANLHIVIAIKKIFLEISNQIIIYPTYLYEKAKNLFMGIGYYYLSSVDIGFNADTINTVAKSNIFFNIKFYSVCQSIMTGTLILCFVRIIGENMKESKNLFFISYLSIFLLIVLGLGEAQTRYSVLISPALGVLASFGITDVSHMKLFSRNIKERFLKIFLTIAIIYFVFFLIVFISHFIKHKMSYHLDQFQQESQLMINHQMCNTQKINTLSSFEKFELNFPEAYQGCSSFSYHFSNQHKYLYFFISSQKFPFKYQPKTRSNFKYQILVNGKSVLSDKLNYDSVKFYQVLLPKDRQKIITWIVKTDQKTKHPEKLALLYLM